MDNKVSSEMNSEMSSEMNNKVGIVMGIVVICRVVGIVGIAERREMSRG